MNPNCTTNLLLYTPRDLRIHQAGPGHDRATPLLETVGHGEPQHQQAEVSTLLHESPNTKPETIKECEIVFHHV